MKSATYQRDIEKNCPSQQVLTLISKKWFLITLNEIALRGRARYNELLYALDPVSPKALADVLKLIEINGFTKKNSGNTTYYEITDSGKVLAETAAPLFRWTMSYCNNDTCTVFREMKNQTAKIKSISRH